MKKLIVILYLLLPIMVMAAGTEVLDPDGLTRFTPNWDTLGCNNQDVHPCLADDSDPSQAFMFDNNTLDVDFVLTVGDPATTDSIIDSVNAMIEVKVSNTSTVRPAIVDSVAGQTADLRVSSDIYLTATGVWEEHHVSYALNPDGDPYTWPDLTNYHVGVRDVAMGNNTTLQVTKVEITVYFHDAGAAADGYEGQAIIFGGQ